MLGKGHAKATSTSGQGDRWSGWRLEEMLQALERFREPIVVVAMLRQQLTSLIDGEAMPCGEGADFGIGRFVCHAA